MEKIDKKYFIFTNLTVYKFAISKMYEYKILENRGSRIEGPSG